MSDENMHPTENDPAWSESYYFNFVDPESRLGMFTRMGFRPGSGWADALHVIYLSGKRVAFTYGRREIQADLSAYDGDLTAGSLTLECSEPHQRWQVDGFGVRDKSWGPRDWGAGDREDVPPSTPGSVILPKSPQVSTVFFIKGYASA